MMMQAVLNSTYVKNVLLGVKQQDIPMSELSVLPF